jgi:undecaprenyl-diphosphatase
MSLYIICLFAVIQGLAELLPVSSSAHVILAEHLLGYDPSSPEMIFLLVMLHTGTMFAVIFYFWKRWKLIFSDKQNLKRFIKNITIATAATGIFGFALKELIEKIFLEKIMGYPKGEIEQLFKMLPAIAIALFVVGLFIIYAGIKTRDIKTRKVQAFTALNEKSSLWIGLTQGLVLPFRGLSRSGATISTALLTGVGRAEAEDFSFALAVVLTPAVIIRTLKKFMEVRPQDINLMTYLTPGIVGMFFAFLAGLVALKWLSSWLEQGRWHYFGYYCIGFSIVVGSVAYFGL